MEDFRRFILSVADGIAVLSVIIGTLGAGITGAALGYTTGAFSGNGAGLAFFGFLVGGFIGFVTSALASALLFVLAEIAANTRRTREILERGASTLASQPQSPVATFPQKPEPVIIPTVTQEEKERFAEQLTRTSIGKDGRLTPQAQAILLRAFEDGWRMTTLRQNGIGLKKPGELDRAWYFNSDILYFGRTVYGM